MSALDEAVAALAARMSITLLASARDGATADLSEHMEALAELVQDVATLAEDPATEPTFAGWGPESTTVPDDASGLWSETGDNP